MAEGSKFQVAKTYDEESSCVENSVPKSIVYKNKWAVQIFHEWQNVRMVTICTTEPGGLFKDDNTGLNVQELTESTVEPL